MSTTPAMIDAGQLLQSLEHSFKQFRQMMLTAHDSQRLAYYGMALGVLHSIHQAGMIGEDEFDARTAALGAQL